MKPSTIFGAAAVLALSAGAALAQTTTVDLSPITESLISILGTILTGVVAWIGWYVKNLVASKVNLANTQLDEQLQQMFNEAAARSIAYAETVVKGAVPKNIDVKNEFVKTAADYLIKFWPELIQKVGLTPEKIKETILARLPSGEMTEKADAIVVAKAGGPAAAEAAKP